MKIAVSSYSFSQAFQDGRMTIMDVIPTAKEMGFDGIEFVRQGQTIEELKELAPKLKAQAEEYGIEIISYMAGADFLLNGIEKQVNDLKQEVEIARLKKGYWVEGVGADREYVTGSGKTTKFSKNSK